jgi:transcriptional regulator with XRE-family HTH domain
MDADIQQSVGQIVREVMAQRRVTQQQVAQSLGLTQPQVSKRLAGHIAFDVAELRTVAALCGVPMGDLLPDAVATP